MAPELAAAQISDGMRLKLERQLHMAPSRLERDSAKFLEADELESEQGRKVVATGNVVLRQRGATIRADRLEYDADGQTAVATGSVRLERSGDTATGPTLVYHLDDDTGQMDAPVFEFAKTPERRVPTRGHAVRAELEEDQKSRLFGAEYTSCPVPRNDWYLRVSELDVDGGRNVGFAHGSTLWFLGNLSDVGVYNYLRSSTFFATFFLGGVRANNGSVAAAMEKGAVVITNLDEHSPPEFVHLDNLIDIGQTTELPLDPVRLEQISRRAQETARERGWTQLVDRLR